MFLDALEPSYMELDPNGAQAVLKLDDHTGPTGSFLGYLWIQTGLTSSAGSNDIHPYHMSSKAFFMPRGGPAKC
jgi:hypothetical protein